MKVSQLLTLAAGAASAVQPVVAQYDAATTTLVVYMTSTYTVTKCAGIVTNCPASATDVFTSTTVMSVTTTICPPTSGLQPPTSAVIQPPTSAVVQPPLPVLSSALPTGSSGMTDTLSDSVPTSFPLTGSGSSGVYVPPSPSSSLPTGPADITGTLSDSVPTSFPPAVSSAQSMDSTQGIGSSASPVYSGPFSLTTNTLSESVPTSFPPGLSASSGAYDTPATSPASPTGPTQSINNPVGTPSPSISATDTLSESVPTSFPPGSSGSSAEYTSIPSFTLPVESSADTSFIIPRPSPSAPASLSSVTDTLSDSVSTSFNPGASEPSSIYLPPKPSTTPASVITTQDTSSTAQGTASGSTATHSSGSSNNLSATQPIVTSTSAGQVYPTPSTGSSSIAGDDTTRITSYQTVTQTNFVTSPLPSTNPGTNTNTETDGVSTSHGTSVSGVPSGSGYPYPSGSGNSTIISPTPSYIEVPVNMGSMMDAGRSSVAAIIVALGFALFA